MTDDLEQKFSGLLERLDKLAEPPEPEPPAVPVDPEHALAQQLADRLNEAQSRWFSTGDDRG